MPCFARSIASLPRPHHHNKAFFCKVYVIRAAKLVVKANVESQALQPKESSAVDAFIELVDDLAYAFSLMLFEVVLPRADGLGKCFPILDSVE